MNIVFAIIVLSAFLFAGWHQIFFVPVNGGPSPMEVLSKAMIQSATGAVELAIGLVGVMALFLGLMKVAEAGGLLTILARLIRPLMMKLFPDVPADHPAMGMMILNITSNMLGLAKRTKAKIFQASTSEVYGDPEIHPQPESYWGHVNSIGLRSCYDEGKRAAETLFFDYYRQHQLEIKVMRIFNTYGTNMHPNDGRVVSNFIVQALNNKDITIYGNGE